MQNVGRISAKISHLNRSRVLQPRLAAVSEQGPEFKLRGDSDDANYQLGESRSRRVGPAVRYCEARVSSNQARDARDPPDNRRNTVGGFATGARGNA